MSTVSETFKIVIKILISIRSKQNNINFLKSKGKQDYWF